MVKTNEIKGGPKGFSKGLSILREERFHRFAF